MFSKPYSFDYLGTGKTLVPDPISKENYRFKAKKRRYIVTFETYSFNVVAVKYCDMDDRNASNRYEKLFKDDDAFRVITTCLYIMLDYWKRNPEVTFSFYAVPRKIEEEILNHIKLEGNELVKFIERYKQTRYAIYDYAMINLFSSQHFIHLRDKKNAVYLLMNIKHKRKKATIAKFGSFLLENYGMIFEPSI